MGRIFRGLHTIKGSGAMFGFECLAAFTHDLETAFDLVRNGRLEVSPELIDLTLAALDQISAMLEEEAGGAAPADPGSAPAFSRACGDWPAFRSRTAGKEEPSRRPMVSGGCGADADWRIRFAPGPDLMRCGANPLLLLRELGSWAGLSVRASMAAIPPLAELDPERCYVAWDMVLATAADRDAIRDVFIFVEDSCELSVEPDGDPAPSRRGTVARQRGRDVAVALAESGRIPPGRRVYDKPDNASSLRVPAAKLDQFVNLVGELVTVQAQLSELAAQRDDPGVAAVAEEIERLTSALRESSMNIRMMPIRGTFENSGGWCTTWRATWAKKSSSRSKARRRSWTSR